MCCIYICHIQWICYNLQAVVLISSPVTMATVSQKATYVMVMMTVEMTVMKKDVVY